MAAVPTAEQPADFSDAAATQGQAYPAAAKLCERWEAQIAEKTQLEMDRLQRHAHGLGHLRTKLSCEFPRASHRTENWVVALKQNTEMHLQAALYGKAVPPGRHGVRSRPLSAPMPSTLPSGPVALMSRSPIAPTKRKARRRHLDAVTESKRLLDLQRSTMSTLSTAPDLKDLVGRGPEKKRKHMPLGSSLGGGWYGGPHRERHRMQPFLGGVGSSMDAAPWVNKVLNLRKD